MAQGCHLVFSKADRDHFDYGQRPARPDLEVRASALKRLGISRPGDSQGIVIGAREGAVRVDIQRARQLGITQDHLLEFSNRLGRLSPEDQAEIQGLLLDRADHQSDLIAGLGNPHLDERMAAAIPAALRAIYQHDPQVTGLFAGIRERESAWVATLKNPERGVADGYAFEALATAKLIRLPMPSKPLGGITPAPLEIRPTDLLNFGVKSQARYGRAGPLATTRWSTLEADLAITHQNGDQVGVDFKHSAVGDSFVAQDQLERVWNALRTDAIQEFHFVSNRAFSPDTVARVQELNQRIAAYNRDPDHSRIPPVQLYEFCPWR